MLFIHYLVSKVVGKNLLRVDNYEPFTIFSRFIILGENYMYVCIWLVRDFILNSNFLLCTTIVRSNDHTLQYFKIYYVFCLTAANSDFSNNNPKYFPLSRYLHIFLKYNSRIGQLL